MRIKRLDFLRGDIAIIVCGTALMAGMLSRLVNPPPAVDHMSATISAEAKRRQAAIEREVAALPNLEWAGSYAGQEAGHFKMMRLAPAAGFVFKGCGDTGICDQNFGNVMETPSGLRFGFALPNQRVGPLGFADTLIPVRWGSHQFLIPPSDMRRFCNDVNSDRVNQFNYMIRRGISSFSADSFTPLSGRPEIPAAYRKYLLAKSIRARIISVQSRRKCLWTALPRPETASQENLNCCLNRITGPWARVSDVMLDVGREDGVFVGMVLWAVSPDSFRYATVTSIDDSHRCRAAMRQELEETRLPRPGLALSTRPRP